MEEEIFNHDPRFIDDIVMTNWVEMEPILPWVEQIFVEDIGESGMEFPTNKNSTKSLRDWMWSLVLETKSQTDIMAVDLAKRISSALSNRCLY